MYLVGINLIDTIYILLCFDATRIFRIGCFSLPGLGQVVNHARESRLESQESEQSRKLFCGVNSINVAEFIYFAHVLFLCFYVENHSSRMELNSEFDVLISILQIFNANRIVG
jgi:hypothetical protein